MLRRRPIRIARDQSGGINPGTYAGKARPIDGYSTERWASHINSAAAGATEVLVKISGGGRDAGGVQAHLQYIDRHGKLDLETDFGEIMHGKAAATTLVNDWGLHYGRVPGSPHSTSAPKADGTRRAPRQAFNIVFSMPAGTPPEKVLQATRRFARDEFAHQHRYALALHVEHKDNRPVHPHVHLVVKAESEWGGRRLNPRKADLQRWRERFAQYMAELGIPSTATRRLDRGLTKTGKKTAIFRAAQRAQRERSETAGGPDTTSLAGDSIFMRKKIEKVERELRTGRDTDSDQYQALLKVRARVNERYREAIEWLRRGGREDEARLVELIQKNLSPVKTENQLIAEALLANGDGAKIPPR